MRVINVPESPEHGSKVRVPSYLGRLSIWVRLIPFLVDNGSMHVDCGVDGLEAATPTPQAYHATSSNSIGLKDPYPEEKGHSARHLSCQKLYHSYTFISAMYPSLSFQRAAALSAPAGKSISGSATTSLLSRNAPDCSNGRDSLAKYPVYQGEDPTF